MKKLPKISLQSLHLPAGMGNLVKLLAQGSQKISVIGAAAGAGIDIVSATRDERGHLSELAKEYRPEIAERLGLAESQVTEEHYKMAFTENPVLAQAKEASQMGGGVRAINSAIAIGVGILAGLGASIATRQAQSGGKQADAANIAGGVAATLGASGAGKLVRKLLHTRKLDAVLEKTAHHKIMEIKGKQQRGEETTAADIFLVQLALNPEIDQAIAQGVGKRFQELDAARQDTLLRGEFPDIHQANTEMARLINEEGLRPQQLVFGEVRPPRVPTIEPLAPGHPDLPPNAAVEAQAGRGGRVAPAQVEQGEPRPALEQPPVTPRSETPPEFEPVPANPSSPEQTQEQGPAKDKAKASGRSLQAIQEGQAQQPDSFAGRLEAARNRPQEASPQR